MRRFVQVLPFVLLSSTLAFAQQGFTSKTYPAVPGTATGTSRLVTADFNADGFTDLVVYGATYQAGAGGEQPTGYVLMSDGKGGFSAPQELPKSQGSPTVARIGDMNGDGLPDIVSCNNTTGTGNGVFAVFVFLNNGDGTFKVLPAVSAGSDCSGMVLADVYQTGHLAVITAGSATGQSVNGAFVQGTTNYVNVFSSDGTGALTLKETHNPSTDDAAAGSGYTNCGLKDVVGGSFLGDGQFDLLLTSNCFPTGGSATLPGTGATTFLAAQSSSMTSLYPSYSLVNSGPSAYTNGYPGYLGQQNNFDAIFVGHQPGSENLTYLQAQTDGSFAAHTLLSAYKVYGSATGSDTGGQYNDITVSYAQGSASSPGAPMVRLLKGKADGTFADAQDFAVGTASQVGGGLVLGEFNTDGILDIATLVWDPARQATTVHELLSDQDGSEGCIPAQAGAMFCSPEVGSTVTSPVTFLAGGNGASGAVNHLELWIDGKKINNYVGATLNASVTVANGTHAATVVEVDSKGADLKSTPMTFYVSEIANCGAPNTPGVTVCSPEDGMQSSSPVNFAAVGTGKSGAVNHLELWIDGTKINNYVGATLDTGVTVASGSHAATVVEVDAKGGVIKSNPVNFTVTPGGCQVPQSPGVIVCSPVDGELPSSPMLVSASGLGANGAVNHLELWIDGTKINNYPGATMKASVAVASGSHTLTVIEVDAKGAYLKSSPVTFTAH